MLISIWLNVFCLYDPIRLDMIFITNYVVKFVGPTICADS